MPITFQNIAIPDSTNAVRALSAVGTSLRGGLDLFNKAIEDRQLANQGAIDLTNAEGRLQFNKLLSTARNREEIDALAPQLDEISSRLPPEIQQDLIAAPLDRQTAIRDQLLAENAFTTQQQAFGDAQKNRPNILELTSLDNANAINTAKITGQQTKADEIAAYIRAGDFTKAAELENSLPDKLVNKAPVINALTDFNEQKRVRDLADEQRQTATGQAINEEVSGLSERVARHAENSVSTPQGMDIVLKGLSGLDKDTQNTYLGSLSSVLQANPKFNDLPPESVIRVLQGLNNQIFIPGFGGRDRTLAEGLQNEFARPEVEKKIASNVISQNALNIQLGDATTRQAAFRGQPTGVISGGSNNIGPPIADIVPPRVIPELSAIEKRALQEDAEIDAGTRQRRSPEVAQYQLRKDRAAITGISNAIKESIGVIPSTINKIDAAILRGTNVLGITSPERNLIKQQLREARN